MVLLFNLALPITLLIIAATGWWRFNRAANKKAVIVVTATVMAAVTILYANIQPSYMPKGKAPAMVRMPLEQKDTQLNDLLLKPLPAEERQQRVNELITVREEVKAVLAEKNNDGNGKQ